jgi:hypothetical protein
MCVRFFAACSGRFVIACLVAFDRLLVAFAGFFMVLGRSGVALAKRLRFWVCC